MNEIINCSNVGKVFIEAGIETAVLKNINLSVQKGQTIAIMGPSGSGKTTLLQLLGLLDKQTYGTITILGCNSELLSTKQITTIRNKDIGFVYQLANLLPEFTVLENIMMPLLIAHVPQDHMREQAYDLLQAVGLKEKAYNYPYTLSGGEKQRVALARALITKPKCLFADEPTGSLDKKNAMSIIELMKQLNYEYQTAWLMVTHDPYLAEKMQQTYFLEDGILL